MTVAEIYQTMDYGVAPESDKQARKWLTDYDRKFGLYIGGRFQSSNSTEYFETTNPATGELLAQIAQADETDVNRAVEAARNAQADWWAWGDHRRARFLYALARQIQKHSRLFAVLETLDNGKPIRETRDLDIPLVTRHFYHHAGWAQLMHAEMPNCEPVGVVGQIIPWNFPLLMLAWKVAPALAMGNTVVLKPAEYTPLTALLFAEICTEIGLPAGVFNLITGDGTTGAFLVNHSGVDKIAFTGSTEVGRIIRKATAGTGKRLSLELGGKSPFVVFDDADLDSVVEGIVDAIWFNQGEVCCAGSRLLVQENIADKLHQKLKTRMETLRVADPMDKATDVGAVVAPVQLERIRSLVDAGVAEGAELWQSARECPPIGCFYPPTLLTNVSPASLVVQEEIFGPVLVSLPFRTPAEAIELANNTRYGLAASVWSENINLALDTAAKLKAGTVWINSTNQFDAASGFGGYRESGFGREGGREGLWEYVRREQGTGNREQDNANPIHETTRNQHENHSNNVTEQAVPSLDRTPKLYIGGKQARPDSGYSRRVLGADGAHLGEVGEGNRKDIRNAVEAARTAAVSWGRTTGHLRAQILYYLAENLETRSGEFAARIVAMTGQTVEAANREVGTAIESLFTFAAYADKYDGAMHRTATRSITIAIPEPLGVMGIACPTETPLLGFVVCVASAIAMGNVVVAVPSEKYPLSATDFYQVLETSDVPSGVVNIVTGSREELIGVLAAHDEVAGVWYFGTADGAANVERLSAGNMKRTWVQDETESIASLEAGEFLREATQIKNVWLPYTDEVSW